MTLALSVRPPITCNARLLTIKRIVRLTSKESSQASHIAGRSVGKTGSDHKLLLVRGIIEDARMGPYVQRDQIRCIRTIGQTCLGHPVAKHAVAEHCLSAIRLPPSWGTRAVPFSRIRLASGSNGLVRRPAFSRPSVSKSSVGL